MCCAGCSPIGKRPHREFPYTPKAFSFKDQFWNPVNVPKLSILLDVSVLTHREWIDGSGKDRPLAWVTAFATKLCHQRPVLTHMPLGRVPSQLHFFLVHVCVVVLICFLPGCREKLCPVLISVSCIHFFRSVYI